MPVYLFTYHTYRSWMPDHRRGYTKRNEGYQQTDPEMARNYERRAGAGEVLLDENLQRELIEEALRAAAFQSFRVHGISTEKSHLHCLISWKDDREWMRLRTALKTSLTKRLKTTSRVDGEFLALSRGASRKQVKTDEHFEYLMTTYLPQHKGLKWFEERGFVT